MALSLGFPRLAVTQHPALRCPDFPQDHDDRAAAWPASSHIAGECRHDVCVARRHPTLRGGAGTRFASLIAALLLYGWGELLTVRAESASGRGTSSTRRLRINRLEFRRRGGRRAFAVLLLAAVLGERPGLGTLMNAVIVGSSFDVFDRLNLAPHPHGDVAGVVLDVAGIAVIGLASALYIGANFGAGPRDSLMLAVAHRGPRIAVASWAIKLGALSLGFALGGPVGIGTSSSRSGSGRHRSRVLGARAQRRDAAGAEHPGAALTPVIGAT